MKNYFGIEYNWLEKLATDYSNLEINNEGNEELLIKEIENKLDWKFPIDFRLFALHFNGIKDMDGIQIFPITEIEFYKKDPLFNFDNSKKLIPFAKYLYEYSFLAFNENGNIFKVDHDDSDIRFRYPDFWAFLLVRLLLYVENPFIYEDMGLPDIQIDERIKFYSELINEKLIKRNFNFDNILNPDWSNWKGITTN